MRNQPSGPVSTRCTTRSARFRTTTAAPICPTPALLRTCPLIEPNSLSSPACSEDAGLASRAASASTAVRHIGFMAHQAPIRGRGPSPATGL